MSFSATSTFNCGGKSSPSSVWTPRDDLTTAERQNMSQKVLQLQGQWRKKVTFLLVESRRRTMMMAGLMVWLLVSSELLSATLLLFILFDSFCFLLLKHIYQQLTCHKPNGACKNQTLHIFKNVFAKYEVFKNLLFMKIHFYFTPINQSPSRKCICSTANTSPYCLMDNSQAKHGLFTLPILLKSALES